jgi:hypothetical protein
MPANITANYMAKGQRVLITSKSSEALNVIRDYIAGDDRKDNVVFEDSSPLKNLIISWGDKEAYKRFSDAALTLTELCREGAGQDKKMEKNTNDRKMHCADIADIEKDLREKAQISGTSLNDFANTNGKGQDSNRIFALEILKLCHVNRRVKEIERKTLLELAQMIRDEKLLDTSEGSFAFFVEKDLEIALQDEGRRQQLWTWFNNKSSTLREQVKTLRANSRSSDEKSKALVSSGGGGIAAAALSALSSFWAREEKVLDNLQRAGLGTWARQIREALGRSEDSIDTIVPSEWQLHLVLLSCKHFLVRLSKSVSCASMDNKDIKDRKYFEDDLRNKMKEFVGHETLKHAIQRYKQPNFARKLQEFIQIYSEIEKLGGNGKGKKPKQYYRLEHGLQNLLKDGELMSALPIWIMPTDRVSEILPAKIGLFDVVILEESSQSDCQSIPVLLRGKKLIIIGDNKQLNPPGAREEEYKKSILDNLGTDLPDFTRDNLLPGKSAFDLFSIAFKGPCTPIWLREHFRCFSCFHFMLRAKYFSALVVFI